MNIFKKAYDWIKNKILKIVNKITMKHIKVYNTDDEITGIDYYPNLTVVRNGEKTAGSGDYIRNGLVLMLDGLNIGTDTEGWTDLISQRIFIPHNAVKKAAGYLTASGKYLDFDDSLNISAENCTIEVCFNKLDTSAGTIFAAKGSNQISFSIVSNNNIAWSTSSQPKYISNLSTLSGAHTISINANRGLVDVHNSIKNTHTGFDNNNNIIQIANETASVASSSNIIGGSGINGATNPFTGTIYAIRIYNRQLTLTEMKHNQREDVKRYNLNSVSYSLEAKDIDLLNCPFVHDEFPSADYRLFTSIYFVGDDFYASALNSNKFILLYNGGVTIPTGKVCCIADDIYYLEWTTTFQFVSGQAYMFYLSHRGDDTETEDDLEIIKIEPYQLYKTPN